MQRYAMAGWMLAGAMVSSSVASAEIVLVEDGQPRSVIVLDDQESDYLSLAAEELQSHIEQISGALLPIMTLDEAQNQDAGLARMHIGSNRWTREAGLTPDDLDPEQYRIRTQENHLVFQGHDVAQDDDGPLGRENSPATFWAVGHFLDHELGVRWLWPGELGTVVPTMDTITVPTLDVVDGPTLTWREYGLGHLERAGKANGVPRLVSEEERAQVLHDARLWLKRHQMAIHKQIPLGHSYAHWWDEYGEAHPEYFAVPPQGGPSQPWPRGERVKLNVGHPAVAERVVEEWKQGHRAGGGRARHWGRTAPSYWRAIPNDGGGFCTGELSRALDEGETREQSDEAIWHYGVDEYGIQRRSVNLTPRYVKFYNRILEMMHETDPDVTLVVYGYAGYRHAPPEELTLAGNVIIALVDGYWDREQWDGWRRAGATMFLRPNWWFCAGSVAPHMPLRSQGEYFRYAQENGAIGVHFGMLMGNWATQGPMQYLVTRLMVRPDLSVEDIIDEYLATFGNASPAIREYLDYWEDLSQRISYPVVVGGQDVEDEDGLYFQTVKQHNLPPHVNTGSWRILPYLYTDEVLGKGHAILDRAKAMASDEPGVLERIAFLREGLKHTALTRDVVRLGHAEQPDVRQFREQAKALEQLRADLMKRHVAWGELLYMRERLRVQTGTRFGSTPHVPEGSLMQRGR